MPEQPRSAGAAKPTRPEVLTQTEAAPKPSDGSLERTAAQPDTDAGETVAAESKQTAESKSTSQLGDFKLQKKLGEGGMGAVYKAHQVSLDRVVALKVLPKRLAGNESFVQRFYREARIAAKLDHPNIVRGFHVGEEKGFHFLAMEFIDGGSVQELLQKHKRFSLGDALHVTLACARALEHAHDQNLVHRDIKPDNLLMTRKGVVKVADLGLAKALDDDLALTQSGVGAGTPYYMAPEQARDAKSVDGRCDIYALGCMLYVFLTGELPFKGTTTLEVVKAKEEGKFVPARRFNTEVPDRLDLMIDKMLARKPELRYANCTEVIRDLEGLGLANETLSFFDQATTPAAAAKPAAKSDKAPIPTGPTVISKEKPSAEATDGWYVKLRNPEGKTAVRKLTTHQVMELIKEPGFDIKTEASKDRDGGYRNLGAYKEFEHPLRARLTQAKAHRKTEKFQHFYDKIEAEDRTRRRWRWLGNLFRGTVGWITLLVFVAVILGAGYLLWQSNILSSIGEWLRAKLGL